MLICAVSWTKPCVLARRSLGKCKSLSGFAAYTSIGLTFKMICNKTMIVIIHMYKLFLSPLLGNNCRFTPTCSSYAIDAYEKYGFLKASARVVRRLLRCHPFHPGGYDPA